MWVCLYLCVAVCCCVDLTCCPVQQTQKDYRDYKTGQDKITAFSQQQFKITWLEIVVWPVILCKETPHIGRLFLVWKVWFSKNLWTEFDFNCIQVLQDLKTIFYVSRFEFIILHPNYFLFASSELNATLFFSFFCMFSCFTNYHYVLNKSAENLTERFKI